MRHLWGLTLVAGVATVVMGVWMLSSFDATGFPAKRPWGLGSPVGVLQLAPSAAEVDAVLGPPGEPSRRARAEAVRRNLGQDRWLIVAYTAWVALIGVLLVGAGRSDSSRGAPWVTIGLAVVALSAVAAVCDVVENRRIDGFLDVGFRPELSARPWALGKFAAFYAAVAIGSLIFLGDRVRVGIRRWVGLAAGGTGLLGGVVGLLAVLTPCESIIVGAMGLAVVSIVFGTVFSAWPGATPQEAS